MGRQLQSRNPMLDVNVSKQFLGENVGVRRKVGRQLQSGNQMLDVNISKRSLGENVGLPRKLDDNRNLAFPC
eukprot:11619669-Karenia_brevis.AAC.1